MHLLVRRYSTSSSSSYTLFNCVLAYEKAKQLLQKRREKVSAELWNNLAVLRHKLGNLKVKRE